MQPTRLCRLSCAVVAAAALAAGTRADVLRLSSGGVLEGEIVARTKDHFTVRTLIGTVTIGAETVKSVEPGPTVFDEYRQRAAAAPETPAGHTELADWCGETGLTTERRTHLQRALELDPSYEPARTALGQVRVGDLWVDGKTRVERATSQPAPDPADEQARLAAAIQTQWIRRLRAIQTNLLDTSIDRLVESGRKRVLAIDDPLAIAPMAEVLSGGGVQSRLALVDALAGFSEDEATLNLGVLAIVDPDAGVRRRALSELVKRRDDRVGHQFQRALRTDNDALIRRAAEGLVILKYEPAVPELIDALRVQRRKMVEVVVPSYFAEWQGDYNGAHQVILGGRTYATYRPRVSVAIPGVFVSTETEWQLRDVTVFRSEVLEALKAITGQNFGFDEAAWRRWLEEQKR